MGDYVDSSGRLAGSLNPVSCSAVEVKGTSVASLVCADVLARAGVPVRLRIDGYLPAGLARGFRRRELDDGRRVEVGARLLELDYGDEPGEDRNPRRYIYGQHRPHMGMIRAYIETLVTPRPISLALERHGLVGGDCLLSSNLHFMRETISEFERRSIEAEARAAAQVLGRDGLDVSALATMSYRRASAMVHGATFHRAFIEPLVDAIMGTDGDVPALAHRKIWLPLFRPGEMIDACRGESARPMRAMHIGMGEAVDELVSRVLPLVDAELPAGWWSEVGDTVHEPRHPIELRFVWTETPRPGDSSQWFVGQGPIYRATVIDGVRCSEQRNRAAWQGDGVLGTAVAAVPIADFGVVDPRAGRIGMGSFNEQVMQGIAAAAWRLPE